MKICLTIFNKPASPEINRRSLYSEGGTCAKKAKLTSVKRLILLAVVPDVKESYENVQALFNLTNVNCIPFKLLSDFKLLLIVNGQQTATSMYPCPYCFISLKELKENEEDDSTDSEQDDESNAGSKCLKASNACLRLKTYGDLKMIMSSLFLQVKIRNLQWKIIALFTHLSSKKMIMYLLLKNVQFLNYMSYKAMLTICSGTD